MSPVDNIKPYEGGYCGGTSTIMGMIDTRPIGMRPVTRNMEQGCCRLPPTGST